MRVLNLDEQEYLGSVKTLLIELYDVTMSKVAKLLSNKPNSGIHVLEGKITMCPKLDYLLPLSSFTDFTLSEFNKFLINGPTDKIVGSDYQIDRFVEFQINYYFAILYALHYNETLPTLEKIRIAWDSNTTYLFAGLK